MQHLLRRALVLPGARPGLLQPAVPLTASHSHTGLAATFICGRTFVTRRTSGRSSTSSGNTDESSDRDTSDAAHEAVLRATSGSGSGKTRTASSSPSSSSGRTRRSASRDQDNENDYSADEHSDYDYDHDGREDNGGHSTKAKPGTVDHRMAAHRSENYPDSKKTSSSSSTTSGRRRRSTSSSGDSDTNKSGSRSSNRSLQTSSSSGSSPGSLLSPGFGFGYGGGLPSLLDSFGPRSLFGSPGSLLQSFLPPAMMAPLNTMMEQMAEPGIRVEETEDAMVVTIKCPGIPKENLKMRLHGDVLTVSGRHVDEHSVHSLMKSVRLPMHNLDEEGIDTHLENGVLRIDIPKHEEELEESFGREIQIN